MGKQKIKKLLLFALACPLTLLAVLNFLLIFTPEMGFDALWYHLTLPKLWLLKHQWYFPGGLLYYSAMPRLAETLFIPLIALFGTAGPKLVQYLAGIGTGLVIWKILSDKSFASVTKLSAVSLFYCTWLVSWQSGSAYIDLIRTFLETVALFYLLKGSWKIGGIFLGLAIGTKWFSLGSLAIYALVFGPQIVFPALLVAMPWFIVAIHFTGNPIFPIFSGVIGNSFSGLGDSLRHMILAPFYLTSPFDDFLSPLAGVIFVLALISLKQSKIARPTALVGLLGTFLSLSIAPPSSRYFLPYLPPLIISAVILVESWSRPVWRKIFIAAVVLSGFFVLATRLFAMAKYLPLFLGSMDQNTFLDRYYHRLPGTFLDTDGFVANLPEGSKILVDRLHNLYYFPRDFDHTSWTHGTLDYDYLVTVGEDPGKVPGKLIHQNNLNIQIFQLNK